MRFMGLRFIALDNLIITSILKTEIHNLSSCLLVLYIVYYIIRKVKNTNHCSILTFRRGSGQHQQTLGLVKHTHKIFSTHIKLLVKEKG